MSINTNNEIASIFGWTSSDALFYTDGAINKDDAFIVLGLPATDIVPLISSVLPSTGNAGDPVTISGEGFGTTQGSGSVTFGGTGATVGAWSDTSIDVTAPAGSGTVDVVVTTNFGDTDTEVGGWSYDSILGNNNNNNPGGFAGIGFGGK